MNEQLNFTGLEQCLNENTVKQSKSRKISRRPRDMNSQVWWKLSNEERRRGLEGVRAIRAILQNPDKNPAQIMAKAS